MSRRKGSKNVIGATLRQMVLDIAAEEISVTQPGKTRQEKMVRLQWWATKYPKAFMGLVRKCIPATAAIEDGKTGELSAVVPAVVTFVIKQQQGSDNQT